MERYNKITNKNPREIVLLKGRPCAWGKCRFCDYIEDNSRDVQEMNALNQEVLSHVTGELGVLEVINSGSCFELPEETLKMIKEITAEKQIHRLFFESHWMYRKHLQKMRDYMGIPITFKIGVETFDKTFREEYLNKHADFDSPEEVRKYFDSPCLMVGIKGQTKEMIDYDIRMLKTLSMCLRTTARTSNGIRNWLTGLCKNMPTFWKIRLWKSCMKKPISVWGIDLLLFSCYFAFHCPITSLTVETVTNTSFFVVCR